MLRSDNPTLALSRPEHLDASGKSGVEAGAHFMPAATRWQYASGHRFDCWATNPRHTGAGEGSANRTRIGRHAGFHFAAIELVRFAYRRARQYQPEAVL